MSSGNVESSIVCPRCGSQNPADYRFCGECGNALGAAVGAETPAAPSEPAVAASESTDASTFAAPSVESAGEPERLSAPFEPAAAPTEQPTAAPAFTEPPPHTAAATSAGAVPGSSEFVEPEPSPSASVPEFAAASPDVSRLRLRVALLLAAAGLLLLALVALAVSGDVRWMSAPLTLAVLCVVIAVGGLSGRAFALFLTDMASLFGRGGTAANAKAQGRKGGDGSLFGGAVASVESDAPPMQAASQSVAPPSADRFAPPPQPTAPPIQTPSPETVVASMQAPSAQIDVPPQPATPITQAPPPTAAPMPAPDMPSEAGAAVPAAASAASVGDTTAAAVVERAPARSDAGDVYYWGFLERQWGMFAALLGAALMAYSLYRFPQGPPTTQAWWCFCLSIPLALGAALAIDGRCSRFVRRFGAGERASFEMRALLPWAALGAIVMFGAAVRLYNIDEFPPGLWFDEADNITQAQHILNEPATVGAFSAFTNLPTAFLVPVALVVKLAGVSITSARLVAAAFGIAGIVAMFLMMRHMGGTLFGLIAAFLTAAMRWDINWSRIGMHGVTMTFFTAITAWLTYRALRSERMADFALAGAAMGLGMWFYTPFRLFPLVMGIVALHALIFTQTARKRLLINFGALALFAVLVSLPVLQFAATHPEEFFRRSSDVSIFAHAPEGEAAGAVWDNLLRHLRMFHFEGDPNGRHNIPGEPMLDTLSGLLMLAGIAIAAFRWRNAAMFALPFWVLIMIMPGTLSIPWESPQSLRSIAVIPAVIALITLAVGGVWQSGRALKLPVMRFVAPIAAAALLAVIAYSNINAYFGEQANDPDVFGSFSTADTLMARDTADQIIRGYNPMVSRQFKFSNTAFLLGNGFHRETIAAPTNIPLSPSQVWRGAAIYLEPRESGFYDTLRAYYPTADFREVRAPSGEEALYYAAYISDEELRAAQGILERRTMADGEVVERVKSDTQSVWMLEAGADDTPFDVEWRGALHITRPGEYTLALESDSDASVILDGIPLLSQANPMVKIEPAVGLHMLEVRAHVADNSGALRLLWQPPPLERDDDDGNDEGDAELELQPLAPIPIEHLYNGDVRPIGLAGRFFTGGDAATLEDLGNAVPDAMQLTAGIGGAFWYDPVVDAPYVAAWDGSLAVSESGLYRFRFGGLHGDMRALLDGEPLIDTRGNREAELDLAEGEHRIRLEYEHGGGSPFFELLWTPPGEGTSRIPPERLTPAWENLFRVVDGE